MTTVSTVDMGSLLVSPFSARHDVDDDGGGLGEGVVHGGPAPGLLDEAAQGLVVRVALDPERDADLLVAVANGALGKPQDPEQVDVALDGGLDPRQGDATGGGDVRDAGDEAGGDAVQEILDRCRPVV